MHEVLPHFWSAFARVPGSLVLGIYHAQAHAHLREELYLSSYVLYVNPLSVQLLYIKEPRSESKLCLYKHHDSVPINRVCPHKHVLQLILLLVQSHCGAACNLLVMVYDGGPEGCWFKPQFHHDTIGNFGGPFSKALCLT